MYYVLIFLAIFVLCAYFLFYKKEEKCDGENIKNYKKWRFSYLTGIYRAIPAEIDNLMKSEDVRALNMILYLCDLIGIDSFVYLGYNKNYNNEIHISIISNWDLKNEIKFHLEKKYKTVKYNPEIDYSKFI